jgi:hypothetical protein
LNQPLQHRKIEIGVGNGTGISPGPGMNADGPHERPKPQLTFWHLFVSQKLLIVKTDKDDAW